MRSHYIRQHQAVVRLSPTVICHFVFQVQELLWSTLLDSNDKVAKAAHDVLLHSVADWARELHQLHSHLLASVFSKIDSALTVSDVVCTQQ